MLTLSRPVACTAVQLTPFVVGTLPADAKAARVEDVWLEHVKIASTDDGIVTEFSAQLPGGVSVQLYDYVVTAPDGTQKRYGQSEFLERFTSIEHGLNHLNTDRTAHLDWPPVVAALVDAVGVLRAKGTTAAVLATADATLARAAETAHAHARAQADAHAGAGPAQHAVTRDELAAAERAILHATTMSAKLEALSRFRALHQCALEAQRDPISVMTSPISSPEPRRATIARSAHAMADNATHSLARDIVILRRLADAADQVSDQRIYFHAGETDAIRRVCDRAAVQPLLLTEGEHGPVIEDAVARAIRATPGVMIPFSAQRAIASHAGDVAVRDLNQALGLTPPTRVTPVTQEATVPAVVERV